MCDWFWHLFQRHIFKFMKNLSFMTRFIPKFPAVRNLLKTLYVSHSINICLSKKRWRKISVKFITCVILSILVVFFIFISTLCKYWNLDYFNAKCRDNDRLISYFVFLFFYWNFYTIIFMSYLDIICPTVLERKGLLFLSIKTWLISKKIKVEHDWIVSFICYSNVAFSCRWIDKTHRHTSLVVGFDCVITSNYSTYILKSIIKLSNYFQV